jgi:putative ABC transport system permease protein
MSRWSRVANVLRGDRLNREIDEELESHIREAIQQGRDPAAVRRAFGSPLRHREESRDVRLVGWLDSLRADAVFGWRQLKKNKVTSAAAILSLALAIGACTAAFRLIDALLLRPLPVANTERLYEVSRQTTVNNAPLTWDAWEYPCFTQMRAAVRDQAELIAVSNAERADLTYRSDEEMEKAYLQYVSGWMFATFRIRPALGRVLAEADDLEPGAHPYAVLSYDYWSHRFARDPNVIGQTFHLGDRIYQIVGVAQPLFTGTQPGVMVDVFVPIAMHRGVTEEGWQWHRTLAVLKPGAVPEPVRAKLQVVLGAFEQGRMKLASAGMAKEMIDQLVNHRVLLEFAPSGASGLRSETRRPLEVLAGLVVLVLFIACANVANLTTAQAAARAREMALRVSIGGGRFRLVQLVMVQSAWLALLAAALGAAFAWWAGPFVVGMINPPDNPARLLLPADWRVLGFGVAIALGVTVLFGLAPALRASAVDPVGALRGGQSPHSRRRLMDALVGVQVAFCFLVLFVTGLFVATFQRLSREPMGFSADRLLALDTSAKRPQPQEYWDQTVEHLRQTPGVEAVALADQPLLGDVGWNNLVSIDGAAPNGVFVNMLLVSPGWLEAMRIPLLGGRDLLPGDTFPGSALVNQSFAKVYLHGENPVGRTFEIVFDQNTRMRFQAVGSVGDAHYRNPREPIAPAVYMPTHIVDPSGVPAKIPNATLLVRTAAPHPLALAQTLRREVNQAHPEFRVNRVRTQLAINESHLVHERLLAALALFFAAVALVLAAVGLYGVLYYSVLQRRREIGIRMVVGAPAPSIVRLVTARIFAVVVSGTVAGLGLGMTSARFIESLFYQVEATDLPMLAFPSLALFAVALLAALPAVVRAVRIDPVAMLRVE